MLQNAPCEPLAYSPSKLNDLPHFPGVAAGRELTLKQRRIPSGIPPLDKLLGGGIVRGRISEIVGATGTGKTSLAMALAARVTHAETAAWIETGDSFAPASMIAAGVRPERMLWVSCRKAAQLGPLKTIAEDEESAIQPKSARRRLAIASLKAAEWILAAGGFGLLVLDFGEAMRFIPQSSALRLARAAERSGAALIVLSTNRICGTFAALSLNLTRQHAYFSRTRFGAPVLFDGQVIQARVLRNKLGGSGGSASWRVSADPLSEFQTASHDQPSQITPLSLVAH